MKIVLILLASVIIRFGGTALSLHTSPNNILQDSIQAVASESPTPKTENSHWVLKIVCVIIAIIGTVVLVFAFISNPITPILVIIGVLYIGCGIASWILLSWIPMIVAVVIAFVLLKLK